MRATRYAILAVGLLGAPPARVAHDVEHGRQPLMGARLPHLDPDPVGHRRVQVRLEGAGDPDRLRVHRRAASHQARADLLVDDGRDAQPRALDQPPLQLVGDARHLVGRQRARSGDARDLPEAVPADRGGAVVVDLVAARRARTSTRSRAAPPSPPAACAPAGLPRAPRSGARRRDTARRDRRCRPRASSLDRSCRQALDELALGDEVEQERRDHRERRERQHASRVGRVLRREVRDADREASSCLPG